MSHPEPTATLNEQLNREVTTFLRDMQRLLGK